MPVLVGAVQLKGPPSWGHADSCSNDLKACATRSRVLSAGQPDPWHSHVEPCRCTSSRGVPRASLRGSSEQPTDARRSSRFCRCSAPRGSGQTRRDADLQRQDVGPYPVHKHCWTVRCVYSSFSGCAPWSHRNFQWRFSSPAILQTARHHLIPSPRPDPSVSLPWHLRLTRLFELPCLLRLGVMIDRLLAAVA